jgi:predicted regulator of Ras-like GTPase activity (Roadblock/LC7/MglB family)
MGYDGIAIDECFSESAEFDLQLLVAEYANLLKEIRQTIELLKTGHLEELSVTTSNVKVLVRTVNEEFFLVLIMAPDGNYGKGRYLLRREAPMISDLLS